MALPGAPTGLSSPLQGATYVDLVWTAPADNGGETITGYTVDYSTDAGVTWTTFPTVTTTFTSVQPLASTTTYTFRVAAINASGTGSYSSTITASTTSPPVPPPGGGGPAPAAAAMYLEAALTESSTTSDMRLAIKSMVQTSAPFGWTWVEDWTDSGTTWSVFKCSAASSGLPNDFHVLVYHAETPGNALSFHTCEGYDTTNHRMIRPHFNYNASSGNGVTAPANADGSVGDDNTLYRPVGVGVAVRTAGTGLTSNSSAAIYFNSITNPLALGVAFYNNGMNITLRGSTTYAIYCGAFTSFVTNALVNDPMPVGTFGLFGTTNVINYFGGSMSGGATRSVMNAGINASHSLGLFVWNSTIVSSSTSAVLSPSTWDKYAPNPGPYFQPSLIIRSLSSSASTSSVASAGYIRGRLPYYLRNGVNTGLGWGDTVDIGTERYMWVGDTNWIYIGQVPA